jgi:hypothetical protein
MTHEKEHVIIHKLKEIAEKHPKLVKLGSLLAAFVAGALIF